VKCSNCGKESVIEDWYKDSPLCRRCAEHIRKYEEALEIEATIKRIQFESVAGDD